MQRIDSHSVSVSLRGIEYIQRSDSSIRIVHEYEVLAIVGTERWNSKERINISISI